MKTSEAGLYLIKHHEGLRLEAYKCPAGILTIAWGHCRDVKEGDTVTLDQAEILLQQDIRPIELYLNSNLSLNQNQFDACVSFCFNLGIGAFKTSTLLRKMKVDTFDKTIWDEFGKWVKAGGQVLPGLVERRRQEAELYFS
jgi:lysozyme